MGRDGLVEFLQELQNLEEIRVMSYRNLDIDLMNGLIDSHKSLLKFQFQVLNVLGHFNQLPPTEPDWTIYDEKFESDWHIKHYYYFEGIGHWTTLTLERKN